MCIRDSAHTDRELAEAIVGYFPDTSVEVLEKVAARYKGIRAWKETPDMKLEALERLELPVNIAAGVARIELLGNRELYMDRHRGVLAYTTEAVDVNGGGVVVRVRGQDLQLLVMTEQELRITGKISGIDLVE